MNKSILSIVVLLALVGCKKHHAMDNTDIAEAIEVAEGSLYVAPVGGTGNSLLDSLNLHLESAVEFAELCGYVRDAYSYDWNNYDEKLSELKQLKSQYINIEDKQFSDSLPESLYLIYGNLNSLDWTLGEYYKFIIDMPNLSNEDRMKKSSMWRSAVESSVYTHKELSNEYSPTTNH